VASLKFFVELAVYAKSTGNTVDKPEYKEFDGDNICGAPPPKLKTNLCLFVFHAKYIHMSMLSLVALTIVITSVGIVVGVSFVVVSVLQVGCVHRWLYAFDNS
jgi:hypothetical protein